MSEDIYQQAKQTLAELFPSPLPQESTEGSDDERDSEEKSQKKEARLPGLLETDYTVCGYHLDAFVTSEQLVEAVEKLSSLDFFIESITGVDWIKEDQLEAVYDFCRYDFALCRIVIRVRTQRGNPILPTITPVYKGANWHEREAHDFFGITFEGHPHLVPLLLPEDADFHPLLKDFTNE